MSRKILALRCDIWFAAARNIDSYPVAALDDRPVLTLMSSRHSSTSSSTVDCLLPVVIGVYYHYMKEVGLYATLKEIKETKPTAISANQICVIAGVTYRQIDYWVRKGLITASIQDAAGSGSSRVFSVDDLTIVILIKSLLDAGFTHEFIRDVIARRNL